MSAIFIRLLGVALAASAGISASSAQPARDAPRKQEEIVADVSSRMQAAMIDTTEFQDKMPFSEFLDKLNRQLDREGKITVRLDRAAFGKEADKMLRAMVSLPPVPKRMNASVAMRLVWGQTTSRDDVRFTDRPGEFIMTTRERSLFTATYDVRDLVRSTQRLHDEFVESNKQTGDASRGAFSGFDERADPKKPGEWLVRQIHHLVGFLVKGETVRLENGDRVVVHADPLAHRDIEDLLASMRRILDVAVVMNARLYAISGGEFEKHFAAAFVDPKDKSLKRLAAPVSPPQMKRLAGLKPTLTSDPDKLIPNRHVVFLSLQNSYRFQARPGDSGVATDFDGFRFSVRPMVSPDLRCLLLEISQNVSQLVKITKGMMLNFKSGNEVPIDLPNVRKVDYSGTIEIHEGQPILLRVDYRPAAKDQVWIVLAEPRMYIEAEEEEIRKYAVRPLPLMDEKLKSAEPRAREVPGMLPPVELPNSDEVKQLLQLIVARIVTGSEFKECERVIGTASDKKFTLVSGEKLAWPKAFRPVVPGFTLLRLDPAECGSFKPRLVGLRLDNYTRTAAKEITHVRVELTAQNAGGIVNGANGFKQWSKIYCWLKRENDRWTIESFVHGGPGEIVQPIEIE